MDKEKWTHPGASYRPLPFWAWNDRLDPERVREQVRHMHRIGLGGFFMHSRQGLDTAYLSEEWMAAVEAAVDEAEKLGMDAWLYDEDRYPSGTAGGLALEPNPVEFGAKHLLCLESEDIPAVPGTVVARFAVSQDEQGKFTARRLCPTEELQEGERCLTFYWTLTAPSGWYNGFTYLDTLNPDAVQSFIKQGLEPYKERFADQFGGRIPGVFTDEPQMFSQRLGPDTSTWPWTKAFPVEFRNRRGYDLLEKLVALVIDTEDARQVRYDFWKTATELFLATWCEPIARWCRENNLQWTGHYWEHEFPYFHKAGSFMAPLMYLDVPGVDLLGSRQYCGKLPGNEIQHQMGNVQMIKLASSVAHQMGKPRVLSETYGGAMSDMNFLDHKIMADWQMALGVNLINPHLYHYSIRGLRKRDYPPSWGEHQPWSAEYKPLADYLARVCQVLSEGDFVANIAVLYPTTVFWVEGFGQQDIARSFEDLCKDLTEANWDYDLADETMMETLGAAADGQLQIGQASYKCVVIPSQMVLASTTIALLNQYVETGGTLLILGSAPEAVNPEDGPVLENIIAKSLRAKDWPELEELLLANTHRPVTVQQVESSNGDGPQARIYSQVRWIDDRLVVFLTNVGEKDCQKAHVIIDHKGPAVALDLHRGCFCPVDRVVTEQGTELDLRFLQGDSYLLIFGDGVEELLDGGAQPINRYPVLDSRPEVLGPWRIKPLDVNPLVLDYCQYRIGQGQWSEAIPVWDAYCRIRTHYGLDTSLHNRDVQPWRIRQARRLITADDPIQVRFFFEVKDLAANQAPVKLVVESAERYAISVNGHSASDIDGTWLDAAFGTVDITANLIEGVNTVVLTTTFAEDWELENSYLIGGFAVEQRAIGTPNVADFSNRALQLGDWVSQGYPFYAGRMEYTNTLGWRGDSSVFIQLAGVQTNCVAVYVNGTRVGQIAYPPYQLEITPWLETGENQIRLVAVNSLRNLTDPLHFVEMKFIAGPETFSDRNNWQDTYNLVPQGLGEIQIIFAD